MGSQFGWPDTQAQPRSGIPLTSDSDYLDCSVFQLNNKTLDLCGPASPCGDMFDLSDGIWLATKVLYSCELKNNNRYELTTKEAYELDALGLADDFQFTKAISFFSYFLPFISSSLLLAFPFP